MELNKDNYFSTEANQTYMSVSQFKSFRDCEERTIKEITGNYIRPETDALLMGSYVDAYFSSELDSFTEEHPGIFNSRTGALKAQYQKADDAIYRAKSDCIFMQYLTGKRQEIMTGELFGIKWKIKVDFLQDDKIVDLKFIKDMKPIYKDGALQTFVKYWGYDIQGFVYQQIVKQNTGKELPFYLAVITKETPADIEVIHIPQFYLNSAGELVKHYAPIYQNIKDGLLDTSRCGKCDYCRATKKLTGAMEYEELLELE